MGGQQEGGRPIRPLALPESADDGSAPRAAESSPCSPPHAWREENNRVGCRGPPLAPHCWLMFLPSTCVPARNVDSFGSSVFPPGMQLRGAAVSATSCSWPY